MSSMDSPVKMEQDQSNSSNYDDKFEFDLEEYSMLEDKITGDPHWFDKVFGKNKITERSKRDHFKKLVKRKLDNYKNDLLKNVKRNNENGQHDRVIDCLKTNLEKHLKDNMHIHGYYDREDEKVRFCDDKGNFECQAEDCKEPGGHVVNPYDHRHYADFTVWEFDHIEPQKNIVSHVTEAVLQMPKDRELNWNKIYALLFGKSNLRFVHRKCHDKKDRISHLAREDFWIKKNSSSEKNNINNPSTSANTNLSTHGSSTETPTKRGKKNNGIGKSEPSAKKPKCTKKEMELEEVEEMEKEERIDKSKPGMSSVMFLKNQAIRMKNEAIKKKNEAIILKNSAIEKQNELIRKENEGSAI